jgi:curli biogenesis system outer membrane secretion channel CsgG
VREIQDRSASSRGDSCGFYGIWSTPGDAVRELLLDELMKSGKVELLEDQAYMEADATRQRGSKRAPKSKRPLLAVAGAISEFEWCVSGEGTEADIGSILGIGELSVGAKSSKAHVAIDLRLVDVSTGKILGTFRGQSQVEDRGFSFGTDAMGMRLKKEDFERAPLGQATRAAVAEATKKILALLNEKAL